MEANDTELVYEAPELVEVGEFADLTLGSVGFSFEGYSPFG
ncbi:hypothetical protein GCM10010304_80320 [Streptomyces roseoviolaceus]